MIFDVLAALAIPILAANCVNCHNAQSKISGLDLSTREALLAGGKNGPAVEPGRPEASRLYQYVSQGKMPPGRKLAPETIAAIRDWIADGAPFDSAQKARSWWAFETPRKPEVPKIDGATTPIDALLLAKLREKSLGFAPPADHRTLIRRLHFALTGLPPKPEDLSATADATITRLLDSPHYGERWARHWLDVVRFAETDGGEHNNERLSAWKYRDYVIDAFNADKPYDQFVREQIAGDAMDPLNPKLVAATGFLVAGPFDSVTKRINRDEMFRRTVRQDELDDFVATTFATFQGLTVACARCHDHKFDPIPTRDYYRLTAVFRGITYGERAAHTEQQKKDYEALTAPARKELARLNAAIEEIEAAPRTARLRELYQTQDFNRHHKQKHLPVNPVFNRNTFAPVTASRFRFIITAQQGSVAPRIDRFELLPGGHVIENWRGPEGPKPAASDDNPKTLDIRLENPMTVSEIRWAADPLKGTSAGAPRVYAFEVSDNSVEWRRVASSIDHDSSSEFLLPELRPGELAPLLTPEERERRDRLAAERARVQAELARVPKPESVHAAFLEPEMTDAHVLERGSVSKPGERVMPGALSCIRQLPADLDSGADAQRRLALARWLTDPRNPLTARVIVNRVWFYHFGNGLVNTPSDFGINGDRPSHPELLDYLATSFMENGWSLKWLHRQILATHAWRQSARVDEKAQSIDASNRLLWHMPLKRMDAETLRDSLLHVSGSLNVERGGPGFLLHKKQTEGSYLYLAEDENQPALWRRSIYRFTVRGGQRLFMDSFDCPDPAVATPQRSVSNTPVQALTLLNNSFVLRQAKLLAARIERESPQDPAGRAYELLFQRAPSDKERALAKTFLASNSLALYCRALVNANEFVYVP